MISSSKVQMRGTPLKHSVLRPHPQILALTRAFKRSTYDESYHFAVMQDFGVRKYRAIARQFQQALKEAQWRCDSQGPIVRCLYVELLSPDCYAMTSLELYMQHFEVMLADLKQLLLPQAIYLIVQSLKGYQILSERYRNISVNEYTIGVSSSGECLVWLNRSLDKSICEEQFVASPLEIIKIAVKLVKERCEPVCRKFLVRIQETLARQKPSFREIFDILRIFAAKNGIKIPQNLRYLLHQHRIKESVNQLKSLKVSVRGNESLTQSIRNDVLKSPRFKKIEPSMTVHESSFGGQWHSNEIKKARKFSALEPTINMNMKRMDRYSPMITSLSLSPKPQDKQNGRQSEKNSNEIRTKRKLEEVARERDSLVSSKHKRLRFRGKSNSSDNLFLLNLNATKEDTPKKSIKRFSGISENTKPGNSFIRRSNFSDMSGFSFEAETIKKIVRRSQIQQGELPLQERYCASYFPIVEKVDQPMSPIQSVQSVQATFHCIPDIVGQDAVKQSVIKANNWTRTFKNLFDSKQEKLKMSICDGKQMRNTYLEDVKLTKLESLSRHMVESICPRGSRKELGEIQNIMNR